MSNDRMWMECQKCKERILIAKHWLDGWSVWEGQNPEPISRLADAIVAAETRQPVIRKDNRVGLSDNLQAWLESHRHDTVAGTHFALKFESLE